MTNVNKLGITFFDGHDEIDPGEYYWPHVGIAAKIQIDGKELDDMIYEIEKEQTGNGNRYAHVDGHGLLFYLEQRIKYEGIPDWAIEHYEKNSEEIPEDWEYDMYPYTCASCGEPGCEGFTALLDKDENYVYMHTFSSREPVEYGLEFCFDRKEFENTVAEAREVFNRMEQAQNERRLTTNNLYYYQWENGPLMLQYYYDEYEENKIIHYVQYTFDTEQVRELANQLTPGKNLLTRMVNYFGTNLPEEDVVDQCAKWGIHPEVNTWADRYADYSAEE